MFIIDKFNFNTISQKGFSLVEIVIVLGILTMGLLGIASLILQNMQVEILNKDYLVASMLAQEGLEMVRNIRDDNWVKLDPWLTSIPIGTFALDYRGRISVNATPNVNGDPGTMLYFGADNYYSHQSSLVTSGFYRLLTTELSDDSTYILLSCDVMWNSRFGFRHYTVSTTLYNWRGD